tara:strand:+ start:5284 stop:6663 length:1380 start_codon:yes stop_codon:yes gene_type:complete
MFVKNNIFIIIISILFFTITHIIITEFGYNINYFEKNINNFLTPGNLPTLKEIIFYNDLSINLILFLSIYFLLDKFDPDHGYHLKIIWIIKNYCSLFLAMIYEFYTGLDQTVYFNMVINNLNYYHHFGDISRIFDLNNSTVNLLFPLRIVNFIFTDSWFVHKIFYNILYISIIIISLKILKKNFPDFKNNILILYIFAFWPSLFFFSSFITKDLLIIFFLTLFFYNVLNFKKTKNKFISIFIISTSLMFIYSLRDWIFVSIIIGAVIYILYYFISKKLKNPHLILIMASMLILYLIFYSELYSDYHFKIYTSIFERIAWEHENNRNFYDTLFINAGEKEELIYKYPTAIFKTIFNPFLDKITNPKLLLFIFENLLFIILILISLKNLRNFNNSSLFFLLVFLTITHAYLPIGYMNSGTTARYALQAKYPLLLIIIIINKDLLNNLDRKFKNYFSLKNHL